MNMHNQIRNRNSFILFLTNSGNKLTPPYARIIVAGVLLLSMAYKLGYYLVQIFNKKQDLNSWNYSELLINYQGGFVRRGLLGELIQKFTILTNIPPQYVIQIICLAALLFVIAYFFYKFYKLKLNWWIIVSPFLCGFLLFIIRKDFILYSLLICIYLIIRDSNPSKIKIFYVALLATFGLFLHESFIFWGVPIVILSFLANKHTRLMGIFSGAFLCLIFLLMSAYKGSEAVAMDIVNSWKNLPGCEDVAYKSNSISALSHTLRDAIEIHTEANFRAGYPVLLVVPFRLIFWLACYYLLSNFLFVFKGENTNDIHSDKTAFSTLLLFSFICMIPMFMILSCDWGRLYQYVCISTFGAYITFNHNKFVSLFPTFVLSKVVWLNSFLAKIIKPTPWVMTILLFILAESPVGFSIPNYIFYNILQPILFWNLF